MNYAEIKKYDIANGPGLRVSIWVSGCDQNCKNCFNPEAQDFKYGQEYDNYTFRKIRDMMKDDTIRGLTILGGEPLHIHNINEVSYLVKNIRYYCPGKDIWVYSGYLFEDLCERFIFKEDILPYIDVLVDGPFIEEKKDLKLKFRGSSNQRIIDIKSTINNKNIVLMKEYM